MPFAMYTRRKSKTQQMWSFMTTDKTDPFNFSLALIALEAWEVFPTSVLILICFD